MAFNYQRHVPKACYIYKNNGNTFWDNAIAKEMNHLNIAFDIMSDLERVPNGYQQICCHMIFDVKMEDFRRKVRLVADGHMTETPKFHTYSSVVSRDTVRIPLTVDSFNGLQVIAGSVINAYVTVPITKKVWTLLGKKWFSGAGKKEIIVHALYGLKSSGVALRKHLAVCVIYWGTTRDQLAWICGSIPKLELMKIATTTGWRRRRFRKLRRGRSTPMGHR